MNHVFRMNRVVKLFLEKVQKQGFPILFEGNVSFRFGHQPHWIALGSIDEETIWIQSQSGINACFKDWGNAEQFIGSICVIDYMMYNYQ